MTKRNGLKPGPKEIAKSTGKLDKRRRDNKDVLPNNPKVKPSKSQLPRPEGRGL